MLWEHYNNHMECESKGSINAQTLISIHKYFFFSSRKQDIEIE